VDNYRRNEGINAVWMDFDTGTWFEDQNCAPDDTPQDDRPDKSTLGREWFTMMTTPQLLVKATYANYTG